MTKLTVSSSPHVAKAHSTRSIMLDVCIALLPATIAAGIIFGLYTLVIIALSVATCVLTEFTYNKVMKREQSIGDLSCVVTGLLLGLNLPPVVPFYIPIVGGIFAIAVVKMLFGGLGKNFANPAITARIFLLLAWSGTMTAYAVPLDYSNGFFGEFFKYFSGIFGNVDGITSATPMYYLKNGSPESVDILKLFLGNVGGSAGEVSCLALLLGGIYLIVKKVIDYRIPLVMIATVALFTLIFQGAEFVLPAILGGGLILSAFFMATDYATTPNTVWGRVIFAFGCGLLTGIIRVFGNYPEGVSFSILFMNLVTPLLDKYIIPRPFGYVKPKKEAGQ